MPLWPLLISDERRESSSPEWYDGRTKHFFSSPLVDLVVNNARPTEMTDGYETHSVMIQLIAVRFRSEKDSRERGHILVVEEVTSIIRCFALEGYGKKPKNDRILPNSPDPEIDPDFGQGHFEKLCPNSMWRWTDSHGKRLFTEFIYLLLRDRKM